MSWKPGTILRNLRSKHPWLVIRSYRNSTLVADLESRDRPSDAKILLERDYADYVDESKLMVEERKGEIKWSQAIVI